MNQDTSEVEAWFKGRLPDDWFEGAPTVTVDREEILVSGEVGDVELEKDADDTARSAARRARVSRFREDTRDRRIRIAEEAEHRFGRKVAWGASSGGERVVFTSLSVPVMTRLRQRERRVLDTLVEGGVARSRSDALAWCVRLVADNQSEWIDGLRDALQHVEKVRAEGPTAS